MIFVLAFLIQWGVRAEDRQIENGQRESMELSEPDVQPVDESREPASGHKKAAGEELKVRPSLPDAVVKKDTKSVQREVFKSLYNKDLKPDQREDALEE